MLLLVAMKTFLRWNDNKSLKVGQVDFISVLKSEETRGSNNMLVEHKIHFKHNQNPHNTACVHIYVLKSKLMCQGGSDFQQTSFGLWVWEKLIQPTLDETKFKDAHEITLTRTAIDALKLIEKSDGRVNKGGKVNKNVTPKSPRNNKKASSASRNFFKNNALKYNFDTSLDHRVVTEKRTAEEALSPLKDKRGKSSKVSADQEVSEAEKKRTKENVSVAVVDLDVRRESPKPDDGIKVVEAPRVVDGTRGEKEKGTIFKPSQETDVTEEFDVQNKVNLIDYSDTDDEDVEAEPEVIVDTPVNNNLSRRLFFTSAEDLSGGRKNLNTFVSDDFTGVGDVVVVELPHDMVERFKHVFETFTVGSAEIQVHLTGYRRKEGNKKIITVTQMLIPRQEGDLHHCIVTDKAFFKHLHPEDHVGVFHVHPDGSGTYMSGIDCHMCADFEKRVGDIFVSGVYDPKRNEYGFMKIKADKLEDVCKCSQLSRRNSIQHHAHPDVWCFVLVKEIVTPIIVCDMRRTGQPEEMVDCQTWVNGKTGLYGPFESVPVIRNMRGSAWTPLSKESFLNIHGIINDVGLNEMRKPYVPQASLRDAERPKAKIPGDKHADESYLELTLPVEQFVRPNQGAETIKGCLRQKIQGQPEIKRSNIGKTSSEPELDKMMEELMRLNSLCASLTKSNAGLQTELRRMKEAGTIFGSASFEASDDHSLMVRVLSVFGKLISAGVTDRTDWLTDLIGSFEGNKEKVKDICVWLREAFDTKSDNSVVDTKSGNSDVDILSSGCASLLGSTGLSRKLTSVCWNMNGHRKVSELLIIIDEVTPDIVMLQETKLNVSSKLIFESKFPDYFSMSKVNDDEAEVDDINLDTLSDPGGVSIMWKKDLNAKVTRVVLNFKSAIGVIFDTGLTRIFFLSIYAPTKGKEEEFSSHLDNLSAVFEREKGNYDEIVASGDWNLNSNSCEARIAEMEIWCRDHGLVRQDPPSPTHLHYVHKKWTFLDCVYTTEPAIIDVRNLNTSIMTTSDHQPISISVEIPVEERNDGGASQRMEHTQYLGNLWKFNPSAVEDLNQQLNKELLWSTTLPDVNTEARLVSINDTLVRVFNRVMPRPATNTKKKGLFGLTRERKILQELKRVGSNSPMIAKLNMELNEIRKRRRKGEQAKITQRFRENPGDVFKFVSKLKGRGPGCPDKLVVEGKTYYDVAAHEAIIMHYDRMGNPEHPLYNKEANMDEESIKLINRLVNLAMISKKVQDNKLRPVTLQEFKEAIDSFPPNKASDLSGISHDMFRHITDENLLIIVDWINDLFKYDDYLSPELSKSRFSLQSPLQGRSCFILG